MTILEIKYVMGGTIHGFNFAILKLHTWLCGYVGIPQSHQLYGQSHEKITTAIGQRVTYSEEYLLTNPQVRNIWWVGLDFNLNEAATPKNVLDVLQEIARKLESYAHDHHE